ncbi:MAG: putative capsular polysaccharide synthesis family protein [Cyanobacteria bacterium J06581_3]
MIYQMGKVGSTSLFKSLRKADSAFEVYHCHALTKRGINDIEEAYRSNLFRKGTVHEHLIHSQYLRQRLNTQDDDQRWKIITLVRDPVAREVSAFFQQLYAMYSYSVENELKNKSKEKVAEELRELFLHKFSSYQENNKNWFNSTLNWFDIELKQVFEIDVFSEEFHKTRGYQIYKAKNADILLVKLEKINLVSPRAIEELLGITDFKVEKSNVSSSKRYNEAYSIFKERVSLPPKYLKKMYSSKLSSHFYDQEELSKFRSKWLVE